QTSPEQQSPATDQQQTNQPAPQSQTSAPPKPQISVFERLRGIIGILVILGIAFAFSRNKSRIIWPTVAGGLGLQIVFALIVLKVPIGQRIIRGAGDFVTKVLGYSYVGSSFVFGDVGAQNSKFGVVFAFQVLPAIIFVSALFAIMYYLGVMQ